MEPCDSILCLPQRDSPRDLHDQCDRKRQCPPAKNHQDARPLPERRSRFKIDLARAAKHHGKMEYAGKRLEIGNESIRHPLCRSLSAECNVKCTTDLPTAAVVRRKRRPPPWISLFSALNTRIQTVATRNLVEPANHPPVPDYAHYRYRFYQLLGLA